MGGSGTMAPGFIELSQIRGDVLVFARGDFMSCVPYEDVFKQLGVRLGCPHFEPLDYRCSCYRTIREFPKSGALRLPV